MRLIDADAFKKYIRDACNEMSHVYKDGGKWAKQITEDFCMDIDDQPTIEPQQTCEYWDSESKFCALCRPSAQPQPRTGKWIHIRTEEDGNALYECSECHMGEIHVPIVEVKYCWNCGAKMEETK